jgi:hypothetical protein
MKALRIQMKTVQLAGLILLFAEKLPKVAQASSLRADRQDACPALSDERSQTGILTSASNLTPAFPTCISGIGNL